MVKGKEGRTVGTNFFENCFHYNDDDDDNDDSVCMCIMVGI